MCVFVYVFVFNCVYVFGYNAKGRIHEDIFLGKVQDEQKEGQYRNAVHVHVCLCFLACLHGFLHLSMCLALNRHISDKKKVLQIIRGHLPCFRILVPFCFKAHLYHHIQISNKNNLYSFHTT